jgi:hypothetical protein
MAARASRNARIAVQLAVASLCAACASETAGFVMVAQDRFDFMTCQEIVGNRRALTAREKQLSDLVEKAESSPGGILVSAAAYRSELTSTRALIVATNRAAQKNNCDAPAKP